MRINDFKLSAFVGELDNERIRKMTPECYNEIFRHTSGKSILTHRNPRKLWGNPTIGDLLDTYGPASDVTVELSNSDDRVVTSIAPVAPEHLGYFKYWHVIFPQVMSIRKKHMSGLEVSQR
jgi:hypothetical protein